ncbi:hypothetical protein JA1_002434 [Spathaspora sp. JA1]|nr:hypothetical protein JA1_002434 [Spathaspora sp. JA1]
MKSLKQIITEENLKLSKLKEFDIYFPEIEEYIDVPCMPNPLIFKSNMPKLVANDESYTFEQENEESWEILSSSSMILPSDGPTTADTILFSDDMSNSTWQTTQILSSDSILESRDTFI